MPHVVFVLILFVHFSVAGGGGDIPLRVGAFTTYSQCKAQGKAFKDRNPDAQVGVSCIAVNYQ